MPKEKQKDNRKKNAESSIIFNLQISLHLTKTVLAGVISDESEESILCNQ